MIKSLPQSVHYTLFDPVNQSILITQIPGKEKNGRPFWEFLVEHLLSSEDHPAAVFRSVENKLGFFSQGGCGEYGNHLFVCNTQMNFVRFFLLYWRGEELKVNTEFISSYQWISIHNLRISEKCFSKMTKYWLDNVDWELLRDWGS